MDSPLFDKVQQETREIPCVHLTGVKGHGAGEVCGPDYEHAATVDLLAGLRESTVSALVSGKIYDDGAGPHPADHLSSYEDGRPLTRNKGRCNDDIRSRDALSHHLLLLPVELLGLRPGVAALVLRVCGFEVQLNKLGSETLDLLLYGRPCVVGLNDRAEASRRADSLQAGNARPDDEHPGGRYRARGCH